MRAVFLFSLSLACLLGSVEAAPRYSYQKIAVPSNVTLGSDPHINNAGQIAFTSLEGEVARGFLYTGGRFVQIPSLGGDGVRVHGLNDSGAVVGDSEDENGKTRGFVYENGVSTSIGVLGENGDLSSATAINNAGQIAGWSRISTGVVHALRRVNGVNTDLGALPGGNYSMANAINNAGVVVGYSQVGTTGGQSGSAIFHAFMYKDGQLVDIGGGPFGDDGAAVDINDRDQILGYSGAPPTTIIWPHYPFISQDSVETELVSYDSPSSQANALNRSGVVVGYLIYTSRACVFENGAAVDLNNLTNGLGTDKLVVATDVNDAGQIVGSGVDKSGVDNLFILTPLPPAPTLTISTKARPTNKASFEIKGTVGGSVDRVEYRIGGRKGTAKISSGRWHFTAKLRHGKNVITVRADGAGGSSTTEKLVLRRTRF